MITNEVSRDGLQNQLAAATARIAELEWKFASQKDVADKLAQTLLNSDDREDALREIISDVITWLESADTSALMPDALKVRAGYLRKALKDAS